MPIEEDIGAAYASYYTHQTINWADVSLAYRLYRRLSDAYIRDRCGYKQSPWEKLLSRLIYLHPGARAEADFNVLHQWQVDPQKRLLDVGCGDGSHIRQLVDLGWRMAEGIDTDQRAVEIARERGVEVRLGTLASSPYPASTFDVVTMSHVIEHVHDPVGLLKDCHRILKPGGELLLLTPNTNSWGHVLFGGSWLHLDPPRHLYLFNPRNLRTALSQSANWSLSSLQTTVRAAGLTWDASLDIKKHGRHERSFLRASLIRKVVAHAFYYAESVRSRHSPVGEEVLLRAKKPA
jgi:2-polyprenyl-3-methyl-5-hydroxy-6-metoxy-1,4-benzoquinol methylase